MIDTGSQEVSLSGHVVEDLTFEPMRPGAFRAELRQARRPALYKQGGFFVFTNIRPGSYTLRLTAERFQPQDFSLLVPPEPVFADSPPLLDTTRAFEQPGDNELIVAVQGVNAANRRISFAAVVLSRGIPAGNPVRAVGFAARLAENLEPGSIASARLDTVAGLVPGQVVRIIRGRSIRLRFDPYDAAPAALTRIVGRVALAEDPSVTLEGAQVRLAQVDGVNVAVGAVEGAPIATVPSGGSTLVLGTERDVSTTTNRSGDYNIYTAAAGAWSTIAVEVRLAGFLNQTVTLPIVPGARNRIDFMLART